MIHIKEIHIEGLRGFGNNQILKLACPNEEEGSGLTILVGPNNSGKSTIIEAIRAFSQTTPPSFTVGKRNDISGSRVTLKMINSIGEIKEIKTIAAGGSEAEMINPVIEPMANKIYSVPSRRYFNPYFGKSTFTRDVYISNSQLPAVRGNAIDNFAFRLFHTQKNREEFDPVLNKVLDPLPNWTIDQADSGQYFLKFESGTNYHSSDGVGEGIVSLFFLIDALYDSKPGDVIVIDEPELSLHPSLQKKLAALFNEYSKDRQIIISTHSPYFVNFSSIANGTKIARIHLESSNCTISSLSSQSEAKIGGLLRNLNNPHIFGLNAKEVFFLEDKVLLVEGQEDVVFYNIIFDELGLQLDGDFFGWGVGGATNMEIISEVLKELGFKKVVGILDNDKVQLIPDLNAKFPGFKYFAIPAKDVRTKKAVPAKEEVKGLLDSKNKIRDEYRPGIIELANKINEALSSAGQEEVPPVLVSEVIPKQDQTSSPGIIQ